MALTDDIALRELDLIHAPSTCDSLIAHIEREFAKSDNGVAFCLPDGTRVAFLRP